MIFPFETPLLFGHRGYSSLKSENTLSSFIYCMEHHIPGVELDVQLCKTGELVIIHDFNLKRVSGKDLLVADLSYEELKTIDVGEGETVPLLSDLFHACSDRLYYDIELKADDLKNRGLEKKTWETIQAFGLEKQCMISSFNPFSIRRFNALSKQALPTSVIYDEGPSIPKIFHHGWGRHIARCSYLKPPLDQVDEKRVRKFKTHKGYPLCTWTVDDEKEAKRALDLGVDGIISNNPGAFLELIAQYRR